MIKKVSPSKLDELEEELLLLLDDLNKKPVIINSIGTAVSMMHLIK